MGAQPVNRDIPVRVQGKHLVVTDALRQYVEQKITRLTRYLDYIQEAQVVLSTTRDRVAGRTMGVEITVWRDGLVLRAEEFSDDMYASIDLAAEKLERQIEKYRSRMIEKRRLDASRRRRRAEQAVEDALRAPDVADEATPGVVRVKRFPVKPMTEDEAMLQMELLGHAFFVFRDASTEQIRVLYRRRDGNFGLIEPEG
ncbi:MAG: ribosome-associated translation inhibitor RaiA [Armatimonadota bacterium]|nr:ribosome-associated translation inhibitor RaiA [Armatimonadota bacterium]MDR7533306.1 ribosome-associated translation inhibitor RaiA [Armatimonadota bacterium]MDR7536575.1 ribosome-associated translation inhibitor RaiA [Armatimonadota bacterium]